MGRRLAVCPVCRRYTLQTQCTVCGRASTTPHPVRYSPEDAYGKYRRKLKRLQASERAAGTGRKA